MERSYLMIANRTAQAHLPGRMFIFACPVAMIMRPYDCSDIDHYTTSATYFQRHVLITIGALRKNCGWNAHDVDRRMEAEDLVSNALLKLRQVCTGSSVNDLYRYMSTMLRHDVVRFCQQMKRRVSFEERMDQIPQDNTNAIDLEAVIQLARKRINDERDRVLFDMYVDGRPNRAMRETDPRSDRQITRLRGMFADLLKQCYQEHNA